jgi:hypothetical protein
VEYLGAFLSEILTILGYAAILAIVFKLFQIATELTEIKKLLENQRRNDALTPVPATAAIVPGARNITPDESSEDAAAEYAKNLLRAVNAESQHASAETRQVS